VILLFDASELVKQKLVDEYTSHHFVDRSVLRGGHCTITKFAVEMGETVIPLSQLNICGLHNESHPTIYKFSITHGASIRMSRKTIQKRRIQPKFSLWRGKRNLSFGDNETYRLYLSKHSQSELRREKGQFSAAVY
jgi:hypothetical protein